jgi:hypothetical protein
MGKHPPVVSHYRPRLRGALAYSLARTADHLLPASLNRVFSKSRKRSDRVEPGPWSDGRRLVRGIYGVQGGSSTSVNPIPAAECLHFPTCCCATLCQPSGAEFEGHSIEIPVGSVVPSELIVTIRHTLQTRNGVATCSSRSNRRARFRVIILGDRCPGVCLRSARYSLVGGENRAQRRASAGTFPIPVHSGPAG